jgi:hypothetical protein
MVPNAQVPEMQITSYASLCKSQLSTRWPQLWVDDLRYLFPDSYFQTAVPVTSEASTKTGYSFKRA